MWQSNLPRSLFPCKVSLIPATIPWNSSQGDWITDLGLLSESSFILQQDTRNWQVSTMSQKSLALLEKEIWFDDSCNQKPFPLIKKWLEKENKPILFPHFHATNAEHFLLSFISKITISIKKWSDCICLCAFPLARLKNNSRNFYHWWGCWILFLKLPEARKHGDKSPPTKGPHTQESR